MNYYGVRRGDSGNGCHNTGYSSSEEDTQEGRCCSASTDGGKCLGSFCSHSSSSLSGFAAKSGNHHKANSHKGSGSHDKSKTQSKNGQVSAAKIKKERAKARRRFFEKNAAEKAKKIEDDVPTQNVVTMPLVVRSKEGPRQRMKEGAVRKKTTAGTKIDDVPVPLIWFVLIVSFIGYVIFSVREAKRDRGNTDEDDGGLLLVVLAMISAISAVGFVGFCVEHTSRKKRVAS